MPSHKNLRTYQKKTRLQLDGSSKSVDAINALFAQNLTKRLKSRRKAKLKLKELPPRIEAYQTDESLTVDPNNTFDKLLKGKVYNKVKVGNVSKAATSDSDTSKSKAHISASYHSPIMTRRRKKTSVVITEVPDEPKEMKNQSSTLDKPVTSSLSIEKENNALSMSSLSYIKLPKITENEVMDDKLEESYRPVFSETFREHQAIHSSTPCVTLPAKKLVVDPISPITKSDSSNSSQLIEKSYDQIRKWDRIFPNLEESPEQSPPTGRRRKLSRGNDENDWKLSCQPIVYLNFEPISTRTRSQKSRDFDSSLDFHGFSEEEQFNSIKDLSAFESWVDNLSSDYKEHSQKLRFKNVKKRKKSQHSSLKTPVKVKGRVSKKSMPRRKSKRLASNTQKTEETEKNEESKLRTSRNKRSLKEKPSLDPSKKSKIKLTLPRRSARSLQKTQTKKLSSPLKRTMIRQLRRRTSPRRFKRTAGKSALTSSSEEFKVSVSPRRFRRLVTAEKSALISSSEKLKVSVDESMEDENEEDEEGQRFRTLRRRAVLHPVKNYVSSEDRKQSRKPSCINVTADILSEKEVSYSNSSFDFSSESSRSKISYTTEELKQEKEVSLPKISTGNKLTVSLEDFDNFVQSYYREETERNESKRVAKEVPAHSIITLSDDSICESPIVNSKVVGLRPSAIKEDTVSSTETSSEENIIQSSYVQSEKSFDVTHSTVCKSLGSVTTPVRSKLSSFDQKATPKSKIIILSNISLGISRSMADYSDTLRSIQHDHSYYSPAPKLKQKLYNSPKVDRVEVQKSPWLKQKADCTDIIESSFNEETDTFDGNFLNRKDKVNDRKFRKKSIKLKPGKSYRRSISLLKRSSVLVEAVVPCQKDCVCLKCLFRSKCNPEISRRTSQIVPVSRDSLRQSLLESYARSSASTYDIPSGYVGGEEEEDRVDNLDESVRNLSLDERRKSILHQQLSVVPVTAQEVVLRRCGQTEILPFKECYPRSALQNCQKIGEGVYGEVFLYRNQNGGTSVMKIIPVEGDLIVNGERQKKFDEILSEIAIAMELSNLRNNKKNTTSGFAEVQKVRCTRGNYPDRLVDLWDLYDETRGSENDSPLMFPSNQIYVVLELANGGRDLESFVFNNAMQAYAMFQQTACALAVAEHELKFEHRDLHWGNILISEVDKFNILRFRLDGKEIEVATCGIEAVIIDFTLSRIEFDGVVIFNDLSLDEELFVAEGDYQFEIYRAMQKSNGNEWQHFEPYTNILWLHYVLDKAVSLALRYKNTRSKVHKEYLSKLKKFKDEILSYNSVLEFVTDKFVS